MFLHDYTPNPILIDLGPIQAHWYGLFVVLGILAAILVASSLSHYYNLKKQDVVDLGFWATFSGLLGARIYDVLLELPYYLQYPWDIFKVWQGGLAIHGGIIGGTIAVYVFCKKKNINLLTMLSVITPGLALGQAIGRWGNYFNQELFGKPTDLPWGIPILLENRVPGFFSFEYFHPTFLYESLGNFGIFLTLLGMHLLIIKNKISCSKDLCSAIIIAFYLSAYAILRFFLETIKIDPTPDIGGLRVPQIISLLMIALAGYLIYSKQKHRI